MAKISNEMVLRMFFLALSNVNIQFAENALIWRTYTIVRALITTRRVKLIKKKNFAKAVWDEDVKTFVVDMSLLSLRLMRIHLAWEARMALILNEELTVSMEYANFADIFSKESAKILPKSTSVNKHAIQLIYAK